MFFHELTLGLCVTGQRQTSSQGVAEELVGAAQLPVPGGAGFEGQTNVVFGETSDEVFLWEWRFEENLMTVGWNGIGQDVLDLRRTLPDDGQLEAERRGLGKMSQKFFEAPVQADHLRKPDQL